MGPIFHAPTIFDSIFQKFSYHVTVVPINGSEEIGIRTMRERNRCGQDYRYPVPCEANPFHVQLVYPSFFIICCASLRGFGQGQARTKWSFVSIRGPPSSACRIGPKNPPSGFVRNTVPCVCGLLCCLIKRSSKKDERKAHTLLVSVLCILYPFSSLVCAGRKDTR